jgi:arsenate reductase (glutaredoxin)
MKIYHNPRCSKSRQALQLLRDKNFEPEIIEYLKDVPTREELRELVSFLGIQPLELVRKGESLYQEKYKGKEFSDEEWLEILSRNPVLIERPVVVNGKKAVIGRPPENILKLL